MSRTAGPHAPSAWRSPPRWALAIADQGVIAIANFSLVVAVTRSAGVTALGEFALIVAAIMIGIGLSRMLLGEPWLTSVEKSDEVPRELRFWLHISALVTAAATAATVIALADLATWHGMIVVAYLFTVQDGTRFVLFQQRRADRALASDVCLATTLVVGLGVLIVTEELRPSTIAYVWALSVLLAILLFPRLCLGRVKMRGAWRWWMTHCRRLALPFVADNLAFLVAVNLSMYLLAGLASSSTVGSVRAVSSVFSPLALVFTGLSMWLVPALTHATAHQSGRLKLRATALLSGVALPVVAVAVLVGPWLVETVLGGDARPTSAQVLAGGASVAAAALAAPWIAAAKAEVRYTPVWTSRAAVAVVSLLCIALLEPFRTAGGFLTLMAVQNGVVGLAAFIGDVRARRVPMSPDVGNSKQISQ